MANPNVVGTLGIYLEVAEGAPATYDAAGIDAMTLTKVGSVTSYSAFGGTSGEDIFADAETGIEHVVMTTRNYGSMTLSIASNPELDAGQGILEEGFDGVNAGKVHTYVLNLPDGRRRMGTCKISSFEESQDSAGNIWRGSVGLRLDDKVLRVAAP